MEFTVFNILAVMACVMITYYLGYAKGYVNGLMHKITEHNYKMELDPTQRTKSITNDKNSIQISIEKIYEKYYIYEKKSGEYIGVCDNFEEMNKILQKKDPSKLWWVSKEELDESGIPLDE